MKRIERVAEVLRSDPPDIRGIIVDGTVHQFDSVAGPHPWSRGGRVFTFDLVDGTFTEQWLIFNYDRVALHGSPEEERLTLRMKSNFPVCPACGSVIPKREFWDHYDAIHAVRPGWLNREHWRAFVRGPYRKPPEFE